MEAAKRMPLESLRELRRLMGYLRERKTEFVLSLLLVVVMSYTNAVIPVLIREGIDRGVIVGDARTAIYYGALILLAGILGGAASFIGRMLLARAAQDAVYRLRMDAFRAIQRQTMEFFNRVLVGQLISRITNDAERITGFLSFRLRMLVYSTFLIGISLYYMVGMSPLLAGIAVATILLAVSVNFVYARKVRPVYDKVRHQTGVLAAQATSALAGIKTVKALAAEDVLYSRFDRENWRLFELNREATRITSLYGNSTFLILGGSMGAMLYLGGNAIIRGALTVGELAAFLTYMLTLMWPLRALGFIIGDIQRTLAAAARLFGIIDSSPRSPDRPGARELDPSKVRGEVRFENVHFSYATGRKVLRGVSFTVRPGERVLITGPPGSGKSTILKLIARLYEPQEGRVLIDGIDVRDIKLDSLRRIVAYVPQEPFIFNRSIRENIALAKPEASMEEIRRAAMLAKIHDFIESLPNGYDTIVGEKGVTLSGGQRQRLALARALLLDPKIVLLDDPVSNLDAETEKKLIDDINTALRGRTVIIVSQRLSLARIVDRILVLEDGRIVEEGTHEELLARRGRYWRLYTGQDLGQRGVSDGRRREQLEAHS